MIAELEAVWQARRSTRGFRPEPLPRAQLTQLFAAAQAAPSWCNTQPWRVVVTSPPVTAELATVMQAAARAALPHPEVPFVLDYPTPYRERRIQCGAALYQAIGIAREDKAGRYDAWLRNYAFFGAPHVAIVSCDRRLGPYGHVDVGVWLGFVLTAAQALGIASCSMASVAAYPEVLRAQLHIPETQVILLGLALGHADDAAPANQFRTTREPVGSNVTFAGEPW